MRVSAVLITREAEFPSDISLRFPFDEVIIETSSPHVLRRFEACARARNEVVYVQDDDCQVDIHHLWRHFDGRTLTHAISAYHQQVYAGTGVTLIGWGAFFPKSLINWTRWVERYGEVDALEADRIFTYLAQPHHAVVMPIEHRPRPVRMSARPNHYAERDRIFKQLKELG